MFKRVLVSIDLQTPTPWAAFYGVHLAARLKASLTLMAVSTEAGADLRPEPVQLSLADLAAQSLSWVGQVLEDCQQEGVSLEIFFGRGPFFEEISRFVRSQPGIHFIVLGVPNHLPPKNYQAFTAALKYLHEQFGEEILLVREKGEITRLPHPPSPNPGREK